MSLIRRFTRIALPEGDALRVLAPARPADRGWLPFLAQAAWGPEAARRVEWGLRRWSLAHCWYRLRLPLRRSRWRRESIAAARGFAKHPQSRPTAGSAAVFGDFTGPHGLARAAAYDLEALRARHAPLHIVDLHEVKRGARAFEGTVENVYFLCQPDMMRTVLSLISPAQIAQSYRIARWAWETPKFSEDWRFAEPLIHEIWAPSEFCAATFRRALTVPVQVKPFAVPTPPGGSIDMRRRLGISSAAFLGVAIMDIVSCPERKNPWAHVAAWTRAFDGARDAILLIKLRTGKRTRLVLSELADLIGPRRNILLLTQDLAPDEIGALHHCADVFLSLHRSEGYGLNIHEALACGKPVIATHYSANAEYGPQFENYCGVGFKPVFYRDWTGHYADGLFQWADPDIDAAAQALRRLRDVWASRPSRTDLGTIAA